MCSLPDRRSSSAIITFRCDPRSKVWGWTNVGSVFLESLAKSRHAGVAVILSGLDKNGAAALESFKRKGGITIVQEPKSARNPEMPEAAISTGYVDYVLPPVQIATQLESTARGFAHPAKAEAAAR
ncbi:MAG TPA: chemotaxis protein CheB [Terriglobales bacterium]